MMENDVLLQTCLEAAGGQINIAEKGEWGSVEESLGRKCSTQRRAGEDLKQGPLRVCVWISARPVEL